MAIGSSKYLVFFLLSRFIVEVLPIDNYGQGKLGAQVITTVPSNRHLLNHLKSTLRDDVIFPSTPDTQTPTAVTVPATISPMMTPPTNPTMTPVPLPTITPVIFPQPAPPDVSVPIPVPVTNPVTTYPSPPNLPVPVVPPAATTAPAVPGQSWCVARVGATEPALQAALDYACGIGGADCSQIQMGASCYNPNSLQNHASYAFNIYYQRNPTSMSCDFGGAAVVVTTNPSIASCIYPTSSSSSATPATTIPTTTPTPVVPTPTTESSSSSSPTEVPVPVSSAGALPSVFNTGNPAAAGFEYPPPPLMATSMSVSAKVQPRVGCVIVWMVMSVAADMMLRI